MVLAWWIFGIVFVLTYLATLSALAAPSAGLGKMSSTAEAVDNTRKFLVVNGGATSRFLKVSMTWSALVITVRSRSSLENAELLDKIILTALAVHKDSSAESDQLAYRVSGQRRGHGYCSGGKRRRSGRCDGGRECRVSLLQRLQALLRR